MHTHLKIFQWAAKLYSIGPGIASDFTYSFWWRFYYCQSKFAHEVNGNIRVEKREKRRTFGQNLATPNHSPCLRISFVGIQPSLLIARRGFSFFPFICSSDFPSGCVFHLFHYVEAWEVSLFKMGYSFSFVLQKGCTWVIGNCYLRR